MDQIGGEPAIGKRRAVGAAEDHRAGLAQIVDHGTVGLRDHVALQFQAVGGGKTLLVDVDLDGDRHARQRAGIFATRDRRVDAACLRQYIFRPVVDDRVDFRVDRVQPGQRGRGRVHRRNRFRPDQGGEFFRRQTPEILHCQLRLTARLVAPPRPQRQRWP